MAGKLNIVGAGLGLDAAMGRATVNSRTVYLMLLTAAPTPSSTIASVTEYAATGYSRQTCAFSASSGTPRVMSNSGGITFGPLTGANGSTVVTHWAVVSAASGTSGDMVAQGDFTTSRTPAANDSLTVAAGDLDIQVD